MKLALDSDAWRMIYYHMRDEFYSHLESDAVAATRQQLQEFFKGHGVMIKTDTDGRWEEVEIVLDDEELTLFLLTWS
jgi:hypothetical protein